MRVSITGGLGFIGAALGSALSAADHDVRVIDVRDSLVSPGIDYLQGSVLNLDDCVAASDGAEVVVHCAGINLHEIAGDMPGSIELNVMGTLNLLRASIVAGVKRFVYVSSAKVYGEPEHLPSAETDLPRPHETYALSKLTGEYYCHSLQPKSNMDIVIIRPFSVYGPQQNLDTGYIGMILSALGTGTKISLPGRADFVRDFVHIDDVTSLCSAAVTSALPGVTTFNAGSGQATSLHDLLTIVAEISGDYPGGRCVPPGPGTLKRMLACTKFAESMLGYRPLYGIREGLIQTNNWFLQAGPGAERQVGQ